MGIINKESAIAHKWLDGLKGLEIGPSSYAPFGLDALNVTTGDAQDIEYYRNVQMALNGYYSAIDTFAEADDLPFESDSWDFILSSHVIEHTSNPIKVFAEWHRVVKDGGYIYMIFPHARGLPYGDEERPITPLKDFIRAFTEDWDNEKAFEMTQPNRWRGHHWVFTLQSMIDLIRACNTAFIHLNWQLVEAHETDDAAGEGHLVVYRVKKP